jgi:flagellar biogenesis protein FliO
VTWIGLAVVLAILAAVIWLLCRMIGFNRLDDDPEERDPYN